MNVIIVGCGKVGYTLAETLSNEGHDITVVDNNPQKLEGLAHSIDVQCVQGNGASYRVLKAVSYTHLDVYKRQSLHQRAGTPASRMPGVRETVSSPPRTANRVYQCPSSQRTRSRFTRYP